MKQPNPILAKQPQMVREYNDLIRRSGMTNNELTAALGVRYECILGRKKGPPKRQTVTQEALLALRYVVIEREADRLVSKAEKLAAVDPLADVM